MIRFEIANTTVFMTKFFSANAAEEMAAAITDHGATRVVFIDTPSTPHLATLVQGLINEGIEVVVRDHHDVVNPTTPRDAAIADAADAIRKLDRASALISTREAHPACSLLMESGEFAGEGTVIVADPDADGLHGAMKALGVIHPALDSDAALFDGPRAGQVGLSELGMLLAKGMATVPPFNPKFPKASEDAKAKLFENFAKAVGGDEEARASLEANVAAYEAGIEEARRLVATAYEVTSGVWFVDVTEGARFDLGVLARDLESRPGCKVTVIRKRGFLSQDGGHMHSLAVPRPLQDQVNLQNLLPEGFAPSKEAGVISNTTFLLHCTQEKWDSMILPGLQTLLG